MGELNCVQRLQVGARPAAVGGDAGERCALLGPSTRTRRAAAGCETMGRKPPGGARLSPGAARRRCCSRDRSLTLTTIALEVGRARWANFSIDVSPAHRRGAERVATARARGRRRGPRVGASEGGIEDRAGGRARDAVRSAAVSLRILQPRGVESSFVLVKESAPCPSGPGHGALCLHLPGELRACESTLNLAAPIHAALDALRRVAHGPGVISRVQTQDVGLFAQAWRGVHCAQVWARGAAGVGQVELGPRGRRRPRRSGPPRPRRRRRGVPESQPVKDTGREHQGESRKNGFHECQRFSLTSITGSRER